MKVKDIIYLFLNELKNKYPEQEIRSFVFLSIHHVLGFSKADMILRKEEDITSNRHSFILNIIEKLKQDVPIQYILGTTEFYGLSFIVNPGVLIPRPETEELVDWIIKENNNKEVSILDIGTGSGCIAITLKKYISKSLVYAIDISRKALNVAEKNAERNNTVVIFLKTDILNFQDDSTLPGFDIIVSNPPYIRESEKSFMEHNVVKYEPSKALFVPDEDPFVFYKKIAEFSLNCLKPGGMLFFEINENLGSGLYEILEGMGYCNIIIKKDIHNKNRMLKCSLMG